MNCKEETIRIEKFINETFSEKGFNKAVIGISGGLDSAVVASLLCRSLGKDDVIGILLPCGVQHDIDDSRNLCKKLGIRYDAFDIEGIFEQYFEQSTTRFFVSEKRQGNFKARIRMSILYDISAVQNALVVGTGNRSELLLGYYTLHGDGACALEPIGHLYKTEVKELAKYLKIPNEIICKAPSAGLWEGQTDEKELGASYEEIDKCLSKYCDNFEIMCNEELLYNKIVPLYEKNNFKAKSPLILER